MALTGLTTRDAADRLRIDGDNDPAPRRQVPALLQFIRTLANPLVLMLLVAGGASAALGERTDAAIIIAIVLVGTSINFWQTYRSEQAAERLRASVATTATVMRDGCWGEVPIRTVVTGDVVRLTAGDLVPADGYLVESRDLTIDQAVLTGESIPADKQALVPPATDATETDSTGLVFMGTSVVSGLGVAVVSATGPRTVFGDIARRLTARPPESEFDRGLRRFSWLILRTTIALVLFILVMALLLHRDPLESFLFAVALGVGLTPEFLPMIASVTLTAGAIRMAREGTIVKHPPAIQNFGSIDVLCCDKTGTLTQGAVSLEQSLDPSGDASDAPLRLAIINSRLETGIRSPLDAAILERTEVAAETCVKVDEIPFDFQRRRLSVVADAPGHPRRLITKGAPEAVLSQVTRVATTEGERPADTETLERCAALVAGLSAHGLRVLGVASRVVGTQERYTPDDERDLTLAGFLAFADPILPMARTAVADLVRDGVTVKILTGDDGLVATHVCEQVGIPSDRVVSGNELVHLDDAALGHIVEQVHVFARVSPAQKNRILLALKARGHVVGYIGDGINDAPSLHTADIGISVMGATDVAREAADVVLGQTGLSALHRGIIEGRRASGNMMKYLLMGSSSNFGNMFSMAAASVFLPFLPMLSTQILLNNFLYDLAQIAIPTDHVDEEYLRRPQRWDTRLIRDFMVFVGPVSSLFDFLTFYVMLQVFHATEPLFHTGWFVESLATQTLVLFVIRTTRNPFASRPSLALTITTLAMVIVGAALPLTPVAGLLGFTPPPARYWLFLVATTAAYLTLVEVVKRRVVSHLGPAASFRERELR